LLALLISRPAESSFFKPFSQSGQVLCRFRLALRRKSGPRGDRSSGTPAVLPSRYVASVDHTGLLRRSTRCSVVTQRARMQQQPSSATASVSACAASCFVAQVRASREEENGLPSRQRATWLSACRRREKRPSSSTRQAKEVRRTSRRAPRI
jgi:hypothetical protein